MRKFLGMILLALACPALSATELGTKEGAKPTNLPSSLSSVDLRFWGRVVMNVHYDTDDIRGDTDFATYLTGEGQEEVNFNGRDTRFGFSASSPPKNGWKAGLVTELDFYGDNAGNNLLPRLRLGYVNLVHDNGLSFRMGQDWIPIGQQNPDTVDFGILAWGGNLWWRVPQLTVRKKNGNIEWLGSLMKHRVSTSQENQEDMPWFLGRVAWSKGSHLLALGLGARNVEVSDNDYSPFMAVLEFKTGLGERASVKGELWNGVGIGREFIRYGLDYNHAGNTEIEGTGGFVSFGMKVASGSVNLGYGFDDPEDADTIDPVTGTSIAVPFLENSVLFANYKWQFNKQFGGGFEVMDFDTTQASGKELSGQRFTTSFSYVF